MKYAFASDKTMEPVTQGWGAAVTFWLLSGMGLTVLAACVLLPEWRTYEDLQLAQQQAQYHSRRVEQSLAHEQRLLDAIHSDPAVIGRLARRELGFHSIDDQTVYVEYMAPSIEPSDGFIPKRVEPPAIVSTVMSWLPTYHYDRIFCDKQTRHVLMVMSVGLIVTAFLLFGRLREARHG